MDLVTSWLIPSILVLFAGLVLGVFALAARAGPARRGPGPGGPG